MIAFDFLGNPSVGAYRHGRGAEEDRILARQHRSPSEDAGRREGELQLVAQVHREPKGARGQEDAKCPR